MQSPLLYVVLALIAVGAAAAIATIFAGRIQKRRRLAAEAAVEEHRLALAEDAPQVAPAEPAVPAPAAPAPAPPAPPPVAPPPPPLADTPPAPTGGGDIRQIKGLGPKLATMLAELGYTSVDQIAALTPDDAAALDAQLGAFQGRMARDKWIEQARLLAAGDVAAYEAAFGKLG